MSCLEDSDRGLHQPIATSTPITGIRGTGLKSSSARGSPSRSPARLDPLTVTAEEVESSSDPVIDVNSIFAQSAIEQVMDPASASIRRSISPISISGSKGSLPDFSTRLPDSKLASSPSVSPIWSHGARDPTDPPPLFVPTFLPAPFTRLEDTELRAGWPSLIGPRSQLEYSRRVTTVIAQLTECRTALSTAMALSGPIPFCIVLPDDMVPRVIDAILAMVRAHDCAAQAENTASREQMMLLEAISLLTVFTEHPLVSALWVSSLRAMVRFAVAGILVRGDSCTPELVEKTRDFLSKLVANARRTPLAEAILSINSDVSASLLSPHLADSSLANLALLPSDAAAFRVPHLAAKMVPIIAAALAAVPTRSCRQRWRLGVATHDRTNAVHDWSGCLDPERIMFLVHLFLLRHDANTRGGGGLDDSHQRTGVSLAMLSGPRRAALSLIRRISDEVGDDIELFASSIPRGGSCRLRTAISHLKLEDSPALVHPSKAQPTPDVHTLVELISGFLSGSLSLPRLYVRLLRAAGRTRDHARPGDGFGSWMEQEVVPVLEAGGLDPAAVRYVLTAVRTRHLAQARRSGRDAN
eukprot:gnl/Dysnectes_brevis/9801_a18584_95.p1 GENE.gnl/Dysnectes_brevis/9801_a18584_95~~gnl/Dysnectes_brevis/9801_a18584_95.p1  ORF type:complete len:584 (-),score=208.92 gnl/Dysnectes_brevis/9801_a18584_95:95-1846(-)